MTKEFFAFPPEAVEATEGLCRAEPLVANTREALLSIERQGHRAGWSSAESEPTLFMIFRDRRRDRVIAPRGLQPTEMLRAFCEVTGDAGAALVHLADVYEQARASTTACDCGGCVAPDQDIVQAPWPGVVFYGFAFRFEAWTNIQEDPEGAPGDGTDLDSRMVMFVARDGLRWTVLRSRGMDPFAVAMRPEGELEVRGLLLNALGRMTNAVVGNPVPIPARNWHEGAS